MPNRNLWNKNVPRVEYHYRARDARLRLESAERANSRLSCTGSGLTARRSTGRARPPPRCEGLVVIE
jgi:hypothetical protein